MLAIAIAVNRMRTTVLPRPLGYPHSPARPDASVDEPAQQASRISDIAVHQLFLVGLSLHSAATHHPTLADTLQPLIDQTEATIRELRSIVFGLHPQRSDATRS